MIDGESEEKYSIIETEEGLIVHTLNNVANCWEKMEEKDE